MRSLEFVFELQIQLTLPSGLETNLLVGWNGVQAVSFLRDPDNSTFEFLKPGEVWRFTGTALQRMSRLQRLLESTRPSCSRPGVIWKV